MAFCNLMLAHKPEKWTDNERVVKDGKGEEGRGRAEIERSLARTKRKESGLTTEGDEQILPHYPLVSLS